MELCSKSSDENGWGTSGGGGLRVRVHLPATGRWLAVLHGGRLGFTRDHDRNLQHFTLKPQPGSDRYYLFSVSFGRNVVVEGTALVLAESSQAGTLLDASFNARGRVLLSFGDLGQLQVDSAGECWVAMPSGSGSGSARGNRFELVEQETEGRRGFLKLPTCLYLKTSRGCYLCASEAKLKEGPKVPCCCEELVLDIPTVASQAIGRGVTLASRMWTSDCQSVIMREEDGSLMAVRPDESYGRDALSLRICESSGMLLKWEAPAPSGSPHPHMSMRNVMHWGSLAALPHRHAGIQPSGLRLKAVQAKGHKQEKSAASPSKTDKDVPDTGSPSQPIATKWSSFASHTMHRQGSFHHSLRSPSFQSSLHKMDISTGALPASTKVSPELCGVKALLRAAAEIVPSRDVLLVTHHGQFLTAGNDPVSGSLPSQIEPVVGALLPHSPLEATWELRFHGDNVYSVFCSAEKAAGQLTSRFLFADSEGCVGVSGSAPVWFPSPECLFEVQLVAGPGGRRGQGGAVGFTFRTLQAIKGAKRYLSVEPNGRVTASRLKAGPWEVFSLADVQAISSCKLPQAWVTLASSDGASSADEQVARNIWEVASLSHSALSVNEHRMCAASAHLEVYSSSARRGWGVRSAASLGDICSRVLVHALEHNNGSETLEEQLRECGLPEDIAVRLCEQWSSRLCAPGVMCKKVLPPEVMGAVFDQQRPDRKLSVFDCSYECSRCSSQHLLMDPRVNSMHHWHLESIRREVYGQHAHRPNVGPYLTLATISIFIGTILGKLVAPGNEIASLASQQVCPQVLSGGTGFNATSQRGSRDGKPGLLSHLLRDPWMWTHVLVMNIIGRASAGR